MSDAAKAALQKAIEANAVELSTMASRAQTVSGNLKQAIVQECEFKDTIAKLRHSQLGYANAIEQLHAERAYLTTKLAELGQ